MNEQRFAKEPVIGAVLMVIGYLALTIAMNDVVDKRQVFIALAGGAAVYGALRLLRQKRQP